MTLLTILSLFFIWLIYKELTGNRNRPSRVDTSDLTYLTVLTVFAVSSAWLPIKYWRLESFLTEKAFELTEFRPVSVHCNSLFDSIFDSDLNVIGHANVATGKIVFQYGWCKNIMEYLAHPESASMDELTSLTLFTHEVMHVRGELNEEKTECQAIQRNYQAAKLLGVPDHIARKNAIAYYQEIYPKHPYFTPKCAPGKEFDEALADSVWSDAEQSKQTSH